MKNSTLEQLADRAVADLIRQGFTATWYRLVDGTLQIQWNEGAKRYWVKLNYGSSDGYVD